MSKKERKIFMKSALKGLPVPFHWVCLEFSNKQTTLSLNTRRQKEVLRNFDSQELTIEVFYMPIWYKTRIVDIAGKTH